MDALPISSMYRYPTPAFVLRGSKFFLTLRPFFDSKRNVRSDDLKSNDPAPPVSRMENSVGGGRLFKKKTEPPRRRALVPSVSLDIILSLSLFCVTFHSPSPHATPPNPHLSLSLPFNSSSPQPSSPLRVPPGASWNSATTTSRSSGGWSCTTAASQRWGLGGGVRRRRRREES